LKMNTLIPMLIKSHSTKPWNWHKKFSC